MSKKWISDQIKKNKKTFHMKTKRSDVFAWLSFKTITPLQETTHYATLVFSGKNQNYLRPMLLK